MNRETRYVVVKISDIEKYLENEQTVEFYKNTLKNLTNHINIARKNDGKKELKCVVVEDDWPEYEKVWDMIETREEQE